MRPGTLRAPLPRIALFSDVDGTLLDAYGRLAITAADVARLSSRAELILASSRTLVELGDIQRRLEVKGPLIAENGAVIYVPPRWRGGKSPRRELIVLGDDAAIVRRQVQQCAEKAGVDIVDQRDLLPDRGRSLKRGYSVCIRDWSGPDAERFLATLARARLRATRSGTWITITRGADKGSAVRSVLAHARRRGAPYRWTAAIGNAANDQALLAAAKVRFAIRNPRRGHHADLLKLPEVTALTASGQRAWREVFATILANGKP
jgi:mannosyl-3-phosphoglycerate phosphatase